MSKLSLKLVQGNNFSILYINEKKEILEPRTSFELNIGQYNNTGVNKIGKILILNKERYAGHTLNFSKYDDFEECFQEVKKESTPQSEPFSMINNIEFECYIPDGYALSRTNLSGE